ncbi:hypothetical protein DLAC_03080 [Tieghemostelium lacteum]|uniref:Uncharacterized protein n=1 Tax=Tieghemostelium lacteum TaxID=361077 RepID=A0A152A2J2_TIELA|nr:hypothetical protein DLAC_03080 [Tieghemostelium lacteum]|eukprot:KYR00337.1 hypothetical protein DLAC_03080 [Tieghemostelium lacteum]
MPLATPVPNGLPKKCNQFRICILSCKVDLLEFLNSGTDATEQTLFDPNCSVVSITTANNDRSGFAIANYFDFQTSFDSNIFNHPSSPYKHSIAKHPKIPLINPKIDKIY